MRHSLSGSLNAVPVGISDLALIIDVLSGPHKELVSLNMLGPEFSERIADGCGERTLAAARDTTNEIQSSDAVIEIQSFHSK
jgi:hypothetical protein